MAKTLTIGDTVSWRGSWGKDAPQDAKVVGIEINCNGKKGTPVSSVDWANVSDRKVIVDLDNGRWAYGNQITYK